MITRFFVVTLALFVIAQTVLAQTTVITGKEITGSERWSGLVRIEGDVTVAPGGKLEILAGTRVMFSPNMDRTNSGRDKTRSELIVKGTLTARGAINNKIWFTSASQAPRMQDWYGIQIMNPKHTCIIEYAVVEYAYNGITVKVSDPTLSNLQVQYNYNAGLSIEINSKPEIIGNIISENSYAGVICKTGAKPVFTDNMITKNDIGLISFGTAEPNLGNLKRGNNYNEGRNGIFENLTHDIYNHSVKNILAENSSWGTRDMDAIQEKIYDKNDESKYGEVDVLPVLGGSIDIQEKVILSQSTEEQRTQTQAMAAQQPADNAVQTQTQEIEQQSSGQEENIALQPKLTQTKPISTTPEAKTAPAIAANSNLNSDEKDSGQAKEQQQKEAEVEPEPVPEEPEIDYNKVFLDAFLEGGRVILKTVRPVVSDRERGLKMKGKVIIRVIVDKMGNVESATVLRGLNPYYDDLALEAAKEFKFKPGTVSGNPVKFSSSIFFEF